LILFCGTRAKTLSRRGGKKEAKRRGGRKERTRWSCPALALPFIGKKEEAGRRKRGREVLLFDDLLFF